MPSDEEGVLPSVFGGWSLGFTLSWRGITFIELLVDFRGNWTVNGAALYPKNLCILLNYILKRFAGHLWQILAVV